MKRRLLVASALVGAVSIVTASTWVWGAIPKVPATDTFRDTVVTDPLTGAILVGSDRIRSDGQGYIDGAGDCVLTYVQTNFFFLRSYYPPACVTTPTRTITLDFTLAKSRPAGADCSNGAFWVDDVVNICGSNYFYDVRVIAKNMFAQKALTYGTPVTVPFNPMPFSSPQFELAFEQNLTVTGSSTTRAMETSSTADADIAELYEYVGGIKSSLGRYHMPFKLTVTKQYQAAIRVFEEIVKGSDRSLAGRSLFYIGLCYEKLRREDAEKAYQRVIRDFTDQTEVVAQARVRLAALGSARGSTGASDLVVRRVSASAKLGGMNDGLSRDGRYLTTTDWENSGNLVLIDVATGQQRSLTKKASWFESGEYALLSAFSPGDRQVAYVWLSKTGYEIRLVGTDGSQPRLLYHNEELEYIWSLEWAPDGKKLLAVFQEKDGTNRIVLVSTDDGSVRALKTLDWRYPLKTALSPDGRYIAYDFPPKEESPERDIFLLAADGSRETLLVQHPADDVLHGWAPEGQRLVFASDRSGTTDAWLIHVADGKPQGSPELLRPNMERSWPVRLTPSGSYYYGLTIATDDVYVARLDATMSSVITPPSQVAQKFIGANKMPEWSPDGKQLAYVTQVRPGLPEIGSLIVTIQSLETGKQRQIFPRLRLN